MDKKRLALIGGLTGTMLSPSQKFLQTDDSPAVVVNVFDRGKQGPQHTTAREAWRMKGANLRDDYKSLMSGVHGAMVCLGKNGDDFGVLVDLVATMKKGQFIIHMSTVSPLFSTRAAAFCATKGIQLLNAPLTGGKVGAETGNMLILACGPRELYDSVHDTLARIGKPRYLSSDPAAGAYTKLSGHCMVFDGLVGVSTAASLFSTCLMHGEVTGPDLGEIMDFLNGGAGGTAQWEKALKPGVTQEQWGTGFKLTHATVDLIYLIQLLLEKKMPVGTVLPMLGLLAHYVYLLTSRLEGEARSMATQSLALTFARGEHGLAGPADSFVRRLLLPIDNLESAFKKCVDALPEWMKKSVMLEPQFPQ